MAEAPKPPRPVSRRPDASVAPKESSASPNDSTASQAPASGSAAPPRPAPPKSGAAKLPSVPPPPPSATKPVEQPALANGPSVPPPLPKPPSLPPPPPRPLSVTPPIPSAKPAPPPPKAKPSSLPEPVEAKKTVLGIPQRPATPLPPSAVQLEPDSSRTVPVPPSVRPVTSLHGQVYSPGSDDVAISFVSALDRNEEARAFVEFLENELKEAKDPARRGRLHFEIARLYELPLAERGLAQTNYKKAIEFAPDHVGAIAGLRRLLLVVGENEAAIPYFDQEIKASGDPSRKAALLYAKATLLESLKKNAEARQAVEAAFALDAKDPSILRMLRRVRSRDKAWKELDQALEAEVALVERDADLKAARRSDRARHAEVKSKNLELSLALHAQALAGAPKTSSSLLDLVRLHSQTAQYVELAAALEHRVGVAATSDVKHAALLELGALYQGRLGDGENASRAYEAALRLEPGDTRALHALLDVYESLGNAEALLGTLTRLEEKETSSLDRALLRLRLAQHVLHAFGDETRAAGYFEGARALLPSHPQIVETLSAFYEQRLAFRQLLEVQKGIAEFASEPKRRVAAEIRAAEITERNLGDKNGAIAHYRAALALDADHEPAFRNLVRLFSELKKKRELTELLERGAEKAPDDKTAFSYYLQLGRILEDELGDPGRAVEIYKRILARDPKHTETLLAITRAAEHAGRFDVLLDGLVARAEQLDGPRKLHTLERAAEVAEFLLEDDSKAIALYTGLTKLDEKFLPPLLGLARIHRKNERFEDLLEIYRKTLPLLASPREKAEYHYLIGQVLDGTLGKRDLAIAEYKRAFKEDPSYTPTKFALHRLLELTEKFDELALQLGKEIEFEDDREEKVRLLQNLASVQEIKLKKPEDALKTYEALFAFDGSRIARSGRLRLHAALGQHQKLAQTLDEDAKTTSDAHTRLSSLLRAAAVYRDDLGKPEEAIARYREVLAEAPTNAEALVSLENLFAEQGRNEDLKRILATEVETFDEVGAQIAALRELGRLEFPALPSEAALKEILRRSPDDSLALEGYSLVSQKEDALKKIAEADSRLAELDFPPLLRGLHYTRLGEYLESKNGVKALMAYQSALTFDPGSLAAIRGKSRVAELSQDPNLLLECAESELNVTRDVARATRLSILAGQKLEKNGEPALACEAYEKALLIAPGDRMASGRLFELRVKAGSFDRLLTVLSDAASRAKSPDVVAEHWIAVARIHSAYLEDLPAAFAALHRVEKAQKNHAIVRLELGELYLKTKQYPEAAERFQAALGGTLSEDQLEHVRLRLAELYDAHLGRKPEATTLLRLVLERSSTQKDALRRLLGILMAEKSPEAAEIARTWAESTKGTERAHALTTWGRLSRDTGKPEDARKALTLAVELVGMEPPSAAADLRVLLGENEALKKQGFEEFAAALEKFSEKTSDSAASGRASVELGRIVMDELRDPTRGIAALERGLVRAKDDIDLRVEFVSRLSRAGNLDRALAELLALIAIDPTRAASFRDLVGLLDRLGRNGEARLTLGPLVLLGQESDLERALWRERKPRPAWAAEGVYRGELLESTNSPVTPETIALLTQVGTIAHKVVSSGFERLGMNPREKLSLKQSHPLKNVIERVKTTFSPIDVDFFYLPEDKGAVRFVLADPVGIVLPGAFAGLPEQEQVFLLTEKLSMIARGTFLADTLSNKEWNSLLVAAVRTVFPSFSPAGLELEDVDGLTKKVSKALPWLSKGRFEEAMRRYAERHPDTLPSARHAREAALEFALVVADDITPITLVARPERSLLSIPNGDESRFQKLLLHAWVSAPATNLRRSLGLLE